MSARLRRLLPVPALFFICLLFTGCAAQQAEAEEAPLRITCTVFPEYDWVRNLIRGAGDGIELNLVLDNGTDMHSFQPSVADLTEVASSDVFIYIGGESDQWAADAVRSSDNPDMKSLALLPVLQAQALAEAEEGEDGEASGEIEYDEHIWLSLQNAELLCEAITDALCEADPDRENLYRTNCADYCEQLSGLDGEYQAVVEDSARHPLLIADRFPFVYLCRDYDLQVMAAFSGCSADTAASFEKIVELADFAEENHLDTIFTLENGDGSLAQTVARTAQGQQEILTLDSMQSVTAEDMEAGTDYLGIMRSNLEILKQALG